MKPSIHRIGISPRKYLSESAIRKLLTLLDVEAANGSRRANQNRMIARMFLNTGLRSEELLELRIEDMPLHHGHCLVDVQRGKGRVARSIKITDWFAEEITEYVQQWRRGAKPGSHLFISEAGYRRVKLWRKSRHGERFVIVRSSQLSYRSLYEKIGAIGRRAGLPRLRPHMFRHSYAKALIEVENDWGFVQAQLGHKSVNTTMIYAVTSDQRRLDQLKKLPMGPLQKHLNHQKRGVNRMLPKKRKLTADG